MFLKTLGKQPHGRKLQAELPNSSLIASKLTASSCLDLVEQRPKLLRRHSPTSAYHIFSWRLDQSLDIQQLASDSGSLVGHRLGPSQIVCQPAAPSQSNHASTRHDIHDHVALELIADCFFGSASSRQQRDCAAIPAL